ncbi:MAG: acyl-CoA dehydrogenase family protein [Microthrixaceae bacterium]
MALETVQLFGGNGFTWPKYGCEQLARDARCCRSTPGTDEIRSRRRPFDAR